MNSRNTVSVVKNVISPEVIRSHLVSEVTRYELKHCGNAISILCSCALTECVFGFGQLIIVCVQVC